METVQSPEPSSQLYVDDEQLLYDRHRTIGMTVPDSVFVVGCGGTGTWVGIISAMIGVKNIHISDSDILELHNLNRLPYEVSAIGKNKAIALKEYIHKIRPNCEVITYEGIYNENGLFQLIPRYIFDCTDDSRIQTVLYNYCKDNKKKYIRVGCNADHITVLSDLDGVWGEGEQRYETTPIFIIPPMLAASVAIWHMVKNKNAIDYLKNVSDIFKSTNISKNKICDMCPNKEECQPCIEHGTSQYEHCTCCPITTEN